MRSISRLGGGPPLQSNRQKKIKAQLPNFELHKFFLPQSPFPKKSSQKLLERSLAGVTGIE